MSNYSLKMVSEIHQLSEKISQLSELAFLLRRENAELRAGTTALAAQNLELSERIEEAYRRVNLLLEKIPLVETASNEESA